MSEMRRLNVQLDTVEVLRELGELIWDPGINPDKLKRVCSDLAGMATTLRMDTRAVTRPGPPLAKRSYEVLQYLRAYIEEHGYAPSAREIQGAIGVASSSSVTFHLKKLRRAGYIEQTPNVSRSIRVTELGR